VMSSAGAKRAGLMMWRDVRRGSRCEAGCHELVYLPR
jgi:hypothetical protein